MIKALDVIKKSVSNLPLVLKHIHDYLNERCARFKAGNIRLALKEWENLTSDSEILSTVKGASIDFDSSPQGQPFRPHVPLSVEETQIIQSEVTKLLAKGIIEKTLYSKCQIVSSIFTRPKKDGSHRLILNLKDLNQFVTYGKF